MHNIKTILELHNAWLNKKPLIWNDPDPIEGNDYTISWIENLVYLYDEDNTVPILIQYNNGKSEAQVFLHEILIKQ